MIYKEIFDIRGTVSQQQIIIDAIDKIKFPWHRLTPPKGAFICGWANLNGQSLSQPVTRAHSGPHPATDTDVEKIEGALEGRKYTLGVMYPSTGNIYIDTYLEKYPEVAQATVSAELSHVCDYFLPLTDAMKLELNKLAHGGDLTEHGHSIWWEKSNYSTEYYNLVAESFMGAFTFAYSDMDFDMSSFTHKFTKAQASQIRAILNIERTDYIPPAPLPVFKTFPPSTIYHKNSHYPKKPGIQITNIKGLTPCKYCKP